MARKSCESILCFLFFIIGFTAVSVSAQTTETCDATTGNFKPNSTYDNNRRLLLSTLPSNVTAHDGYFNGSIGLGPDRVYAMGMCAPGAKPDVCSNCIKTTSESLLKTCLNQMDGFSWSGEKILCHVRYSSKSFFGLLVLKPDDGLYNVNEIRKENQKEFDSVWDVLMSRMVGRASSSVRNTSSSSSLSLSGRYYAKDVAPVPIYGNISVLMQCTPDVSLKDCKLCLERNLDYYKSFYHGKRGSIIYRPSCFFRWELYSFSGAFDSINDIRSPPPSPPSVPNRTNINKKNDRKISGGTIAAIIVVIVVTITLIVVGLVICKRRNQNKDIELPTESIQFDLKTIEAATSNFSDRNKLGEGGFGEVYKGMLMNGTEIAVKRLSKTSGQGEVEFKNEVVVVAKLQHINLVRLLGFSLQGEEKLLVYEYVPNKSLDYFLFDPNKRIQLDWTVRRNIIGGITRGVLYLHQDSRLKIIHRDLKASNILLDANMNPKIADFGMARIFGVDQTVANTARVVGTFGYMSPEYVTHGQFSMKSDVYSFGVLILEIISGKKNSSFYQMDGLVNNLVTYVWRLWENKSLPDLVDPGIKEDCTTDEVIRYIHIGLLCVQENPADRPTMSMLHQMLTTSSITLPVPLPPGFFFNNRPGSNPPAQRLESSHSTSKSITSSVDEATITYVDPR
ncbi:PREDICTED: cysteine-rich receptor-like protein kinase 17 [Camelina sativa]|uniref:Cysteine-rich receptor-like protein kinase 17 n=1 Tax=Camelina sativa TaxID=90675 RepID=A0ABM1QI72_CAMSA|nr:PREDICTED: cysteine-rich receptor-like protein kinase 17 [Camelina sativa]